MRCSPPRFPGAGLSITRQRKRAGGSDAFARTITGSNAIALGKTGRALTPRRAGGICRRQRFLCSGETMRITVFGTGYVGLVQGAVLAEVGHDVLCVDVDAAKVEGLKAGRIPIYEPGLEDLVKKNHAEGRLNFTTDAAAGVAHGRIQFIAVGTPPDEDGSADLKYVLAVAETIAGHMTEPKIVVTKSTVPVGTADKVRARHGRSSPRAARAAPISASTWSPTRSSSRKAPPSPTACGPTASSSAPASAEAEEVLREVYAPFNRNHDKIIVMDVRSAELTKYAANCMLATKISFMNEMANLAERLGADVEMVRQGIGADQRIGYHFIYPGAGYGGSCFPKDVKALIHTARCDRLRADAAAAVEDRNDAQKTVLFDKIAQHFDGDLAGRPSPSGASPSSPTPTTCARRPAAC